MLGLGISGVSAANFCAALGADVVAADERPREQLPAARDLRPDVGLQLGCAFPSCADFDLVVPSPGIPAVRYAEDARQVWGDIELAYRALKIPIIAVTGTNGKSTTVSLVEAMLRSAGLRARAAGNLGTPALELVGEALDAAVLEVSSFQLEAVEEFAPHVAVILNLTPDHLDRHGDFDHYVAAKRRVLEGQGPRDVAVLNFDDPTVRALASSTRAEILAFGITPPAAAGARSVGLDGSSLLLHDEGKTRRIGLDGLTLVGRHNLENVMAAVASLWALGVDPVDGLKALASFHPLPHRCEVVTRHAGVTFVNDSKATNVGAAIRSLQGFAEPLLWIAGGRDKGLDFDALADAAQGRARIAYLIGETAPKIRDALAGRVECVLVETLDEAVRAASAAARPGDVVLLCPACASFDQFEGFEARGDQFRASVHGVVDGGSH